VALVSEAIAIGSWSNPESIVAFKGTSPDIRKNLHTERFAVKLLPFIRDHEVVH
jgi:hypothetical protein